MCVAGSAPAAAAGGQRFVPVSDVSWQKIWSAPAKSGGYH